MDVDTGRASVKRLLMLPQSAARGGMVIRACGAPLRWEAGASSTTTSAFVGHRQDDCAGEQSEIGEGISALERTCRAGEQATRVLIEDVTRPECGKFEVRPILFAIEGAAHSGVSRGLATV